MLDSRIKRQRVEAPEGFHIEGRSPLHVIVRERIPNCNECKVVPVALILDFGDSKKIIPMDQINFIDLEPELIKIYCYPDHTKYWGIATSDAATLKSEYERLRVQFIDFKTFKLFGHIHETEAPMLPHLACCDEGATEVNPSPDT